MIFGLRDQQSGDQRPDDGGQARKRGREAGADHDEQAGGEEQFRALGARGLREQAGQGDPPGDQQHRDHDPADDECVDQPLPPFGLRGGGHGAEDEDDRHDHDILEQQHRERRAAHGRVRARYRQDDRGGGEGEREAQRQRPGPVLADHREDDRQHHAGDKQFERAQSEHQPAHLPQSLETQFQPDGEQQQDDPEFREGFQRLGIGDRYVTEPGSFVDQLSEPEGADRDADQDEPDDGRDAEAGEDRDDEPRRAEDHQRIGYHRGRFDLAGHGSVL